MVTRKTRGAKFGDATTRASTIPVYNPFEGLRHIDNEPKVRETRSLRIDPSLRLESAPAPKRRRRGCHAKQVQDPTFFDPDICARRIRQRVPGRIFSHFNATTHEEYTRADVLNASIPRPVPTRPTKRSADNLNDFEPGKRANVSALDTCPIQASPPSPPNGGGEPGAAPGPRDGAAPAVLPPAEAPASLWTWGVTAIGATLRTTCNFVLQRVRSARAPGSDESIT